MRAVEIIGIFTCASMKPKNIVSNWVNLKNQLYEDCWEIQVITPSVEGVIEPRIKALAKDFPVQRNSLDRSHVGENKAISMLEQKWIHETQ